MNAILRILPAFAAAAAALLAVAPSTADAQLRRPGIVTIKQPDPNKSSLIREKGSIYLEGMVTAPVPVKVSDSTPAYADLAGQRWVGNVLGSQGAELLAVSERAYKVKAKAQQGQISGWVRKDAVSGLPDGFEEKLVQFHQRYLIVKQLIDNKQVALGMTTEEVMASIGPPDTRSSQMDATGRKELFSFISYTRVPQTVVGVNIFGQPTTMTQYVEVESGRVSIEFTNNLATSISESEGLKVNQGLPTPPIPPFIPLF